MSSFRFLCKPTPSRLRVGIPVAFFLMAGTLLATACSEGSSADLDASPTLPTEAGPGPTKTPLPNPDDDPEEDAGASDAKADANANDGASDAKPDVVKGPFACSAATFPATVSVKEASGSAEVELTAGVREILVVADSGNNGAALLVAIPSGTTRAITLPIDDLPAADDTEGIAWYGGKLYAITSSGGVRRFAPNGSGGLVRDQDLYALGASPYACEDLTGVNCGKNYEGLCLRSGTVPANGCVGYAASKAEGKLYCVTVDANGRLHASTTVPPLALGLSPIPDQLSDCAFGTAGGPGEEALVIATNVFNGSKTYRVNETTGATTELPMKSLLNTESIAIDKDGSLYVFDDHPLGLGTTSNAAKMTCQNW